MIAELPPEPWVVTSASGNAQAIHSLTDNLDRLLQAAQGDVATAVCGFWNQRDLGSHPGDQDRAGVCVTDRAKSPRTKPAVMTNRSISDRQGRTFATFAVKLPVPYWLRETSTTVSSLSLTSATASTAGATSSTTFAIASRIYRTTTPSGTSSPTSASSSSRT